MHAVACMHRQWMASAVNYTRVQGTFDAATQESAVLLVYPSKLAKGRRRPRGFVDTPRTDDLIREVGSFAACADQAQRIVERHTFQRVRHFDSQAIRQWFGCAGRAAAHMWVMRARSLHGEHGCLTRGGGGTRVAQVAPHSPTIGTTTTSRRHKNNEEF